MDTRYRLVVVFPRRASRPIDRAARPIDRTTTRCPESLGSRGKPESMPDLGLVTVSSDDLRKLLRLLFRKQVECPLTPAGLAGAGLQDASGPLLAHLRGLDDKAVHAVLVAALAEREATDEQRTRRHLR